MPPGRSKNKLGEVAAAESYREREAARRKGFVTPMVQAVGDAAPSRSARGYTISKLIACLAGLAVVAWFLWSSGPFPFPYDDSYITLEFAHNLAATGRLTFDGIHRAGGATSLLHVALLALPARLGLPLELADASLGILFFVLLIERTGAVAMHLTGSWEASLYAALVTALTGHMVFDALNGLETTLFMFLAMTCLGSLLKSRNPGGSRWWPALWINLTALARPEGYWFAASLLLYLATLMALRREKIRHRAILSGYLAGAILLALATQRLLTGSFTPHTALAKVYFFNQYRLPFLERWSAYSHGMNLIWVPLAMPLFPALFAQRSRPLLVAVLPWIFSTQIMFLMLLPIESFAYGGRYLHPFMPFLFILAGDGINVLLHSRGKYRVPRWATALVVACVTVICYLNLVARLGNYENAKASIYNNHIWAVKWLQANAPPNILVATHDIGVLRYVGHFRLLDIVGLVNEEAMARNRAERGQFDYLLEKRPDYIVADPSWLKYLAHYPPTLNLYATTVAVAHPNAYGVVQLRIYRCHWDQGGSLPPLTNNSPNL